MIDVVAGVIMYILLGGLAYCLAALAMLDDKKMLKKYASVFIFWPVVCAIFLVVQIKVGSSLFGEFIRMIINRSKL
jgi:heme A synthase